MIIDGRRPIAGISNNDAAALLDWTFSWFTPALGAVTCTGQLVPLSGSIAHSSDTRVIKDNRGNEVTVFFTNEKITIEVVAVPLGVTVTPPVGGVNTLAAALSAAQFPSPGGWLTIAQAPVLIIGSFTNAFNSADWLYNGDGRVELASEGEWGMRFSCTRRANLSRVAGVTI